MSESLIIQSSARAVVGLAPAMNGLAACPAERTAAAAACERGYFRPDEDLLVRSWFERYLTVRGALLEVVDDLTPLATQGDADGTRLRAFLVSYTAACLLVRSGRMLVGEFGTHRIVQRKLNEGDPDHRLPRKQYTRIYRALTLPINAWRLSEAMRFADERRGELEALGADDPLMAAVLGYLLEAEESLRIGVRQYMRARLRYRWHSYRRRRASAVQQGLFRIAEAFGRVIAEIRTPGHRDRVTPEHRAMLAEMLRPGDVIVTRHDHAFSNLFLPGYWPHAALHVGARADAEALGAAIDEPHAGRWVDPLRVLEARKDGVRLRPLHDTFAVDSFAILRPNIGGDELARALANALRHEGKGYNFDFDFFTSDRLVCTEVIYRAYEGVGGIAFALKERAGRMTLSAEDLLDLAVEERGFEAIAIFGSPNVGNTLITGGDARAAVAGSYASVKGNPGSCSLRPVE